MLDIELGNHDGLELLQNIRETYYTLPVILCTAYRAFKYGFLREQSSGLFRLGKGELTRLVLSEKIEIRWHQKRHKFVTTAIEEIWDGT